MCNGSEKYVSLRFVADKFMKISFWKIRKSFFSVVCQDFYKFFLRIVRWSTVTYKCLSQLCSIWVQHLATSILEFADKIIIHDSRVNSERGSTAMFERKYPWYTFYAAEILHRKMYSKITRPASEAFSDQNLKMIPK